MSSAACYRLPRKCGATWKKPASGSSSMGVRSLSPGQSTSSGRRGGCRCGSRSVRATSRRGRSRWHGARAARRRCDWMILRSEEHTSELQSHVNLVCRLLLEKKKKKKKEKKIKEKKTKQR